MICVAPSTLPLASATVTSCWTGDWLVKSIVTFPALAAVSLVCSYLSCPLGSAATLTLEPAAEGAAGLGFFGAGAGAGLVPHFTCEALTSLLGWSSVVGLT